MSIVGCPVTEPVRQAIRALPDPFWHSALEQDGSLRVGAGVAELAGLAGLAGRPDGAESSRANARTPAPTLAERADHGIHPTRGPAQTSHLTCRPVPVRPRSEETGAPRPRRAAATPTHRQRRSPPTNRISPCQFTQPKHER